MTEGGERERGPTRMADRPSVRPSPGVVGPHRPETNGGQVRVSSPVLSFQFSFHCWNCIVVSSNSVKECYYLLGHSLMIRVGRDRKRSKIVRRSRTEDGRAQGCKLLFRTNRDDWPTELQRERTSDTVHRSRVFTHRKIRPIQYFCRFTRLRPAGTEYHSSKLNKPPLMWGTLWAKRFRVLQNSSSVLTHEQKWIRIAN